MHAKRRITYISSILKAFSATKSIEKKPRCSASYGKCSRAFVKNAFDPNIQSKGSKLDLFLRSNPKKIYRNHAIFRDLFIFSIAGSFEIDLTRQKFEQVIVSYRTCLNVNVNENIWNNRGRITGILAWNIRIRETLVCGKRRRRKERMYV